MKTSSIAPVMTTAPTEPSPSRDRTRASSSATIGPVMKLRGGLSSRTVSTRPVCSVCTVWATAPPSLGYGGEPSRAAPCGSPSAAGLEAQRLAQDLLHDLVRAPADRAEAGVPGRALDVVLAHVAGAAVDLQAGVHQIERRALGGQLGHRHLADRVGALDEEPQRVVGQAAPGLDRGRHLGELVA